MRLCLQHLLPQALTADRSTWTGIVQFRGETADSCAECEDQNESVLECRTACGGFHKPRDPNIN